MSLKRLFRKTIQKGSTVYGVVESYYNGLATVRVGGSRLTNLSTTGGSIDIGATVIVDYSTGTIPVVHPLYVTDDDYEADQFEEAEIVFKDQPTIVVEELVETPPHISNMELDVGFSIGQYDAQPNFSDPAQPWLYGEDTPVVFAHNWPEYGLYECIFYDTDHSCNWSKYGADYVTIPMSGKWILNAYHYTSIQHGTGCVNMNRQGYYRIAISKNNVIIAETTHQDQVQADDDAFQISATVVTIDDCSAGDQIRLIMFQTNMDNQTNGWDYYYCNKDGSWPNWGIAGQPYNAYGMWDGQCHLTGQILPGSQA